MPERAIKLVAVLSFISRFEDTVIGKLLNLMEFLPIPHAMYLFTILLF